MNLEKILKDHEIWLNKRALNHHVLWLKEKEGGNATLRWTNLTNPDLSGADLREADLRRLDMSNVNLSGADLFGADLSGADLREACLIKANLAHANLNSANLNGANLTKAYLSEANVANCSRFLTAKFDPRGYQLKVWREKSGIWVSSGCYTFPIDQALRHWRHRQYERYPELGKYYVKTIKELAKRL